MADLLNFLENHAFNQPDKTALVFEDQRLTYGEWFGQVRRAAAGLADLGIRPGDHVAVTAYWGNEVMVVTYALQWLGAVPVLASYSLLNDLPGLLQDTDAVALVYGAESRPLLESALPALQGRKLLISLDSGGGPGVHFGELLAAAPGDPAPRDPATVSGIIFSAGTTGRPKPILRTYATDLWDGIQKSLIYRLGYGDSWIYISPKNLTALIGPTRPILVTGASYVVIDGFDAEKVARVCEQERVTQLTLLSGQWAEFLAQQGLDRYDLSALRQVSVSASQVPSDLKRRMTERFGELPSLQIYGSSEAGMVSCIQEGDGKATVPGCVGRPLATLQARVLRPVTDPAATEADYRTLQDVPAGDIGEVAVKGPSVAPGYYKRADATRKAFVDGWIRTGDLGKFDEDGALYLADRISDVISLEGHPVYPSVVQDSLFSVPGVVEAAFIGKATDRGPQLVVFVVSQPQAGPDAAAVLAAATDGLRRCGVQDEHAIEIRALPALPRTPAGKVDRRKLAESV